MSSEHFSPTEISDCSLCPRKCRADRTKSQYGFCGQTSEIQIARAALHFWEEPCISGPNGSGTIFFCGCNLRCIFCQNSVLSSSKLGKTVSVSRLTDILLELQEQGAHNINLVTPGHFIPQLIRALTSAKDNGLSIPIVYNTGSYETATSVKMLDGLIDIYLPDLKYFDTILSEKLSQAPDYFNVATAAIAEMYRQTGPCVFEDSLLKKGVLIRHLVLPGHTKDSKNVIKYIYDTYEDDVFISIMNQYTPIADASLRLSQAGFPELNRPLTPREYEKVVNYALDLGITNAFIQEGPTCKESFIPVWDYTGV